MGAVMVQLTDLGVLALASLPRLRRLAAAGLPRLTDNALGFVAEHAAGLEELHLPYCGGVGLDGVRAVLRRLAGLARLDVTGVPAMRRRGIGRFSEGPPEVRVCGVVERKGRGTFVRSLLGPFQPGTARKGHNPVVWSAP